ncbi:MAG: TetR/AcrR family transcriptional regulator [Desulfobacterales bacterium]|nr:TetR/AcrR family transcriptional regulator [Desulfobacterales bacterium]
MKTQRKKIKIIEAAGRIFSQKGFHQTKMDEIAEKAQVAKGTLYYNFSSKSKLFAATVTHGLNEVMDTIKTELESNLPFKDHFHSLVGAVIRVYIRNSEVTRIYANELSSGIEPKVLNEIKAVRQNFIDFIEEKLVMGEKKGYLKSMPPSLTAVSVIALMDSLCNHYLENPKTATEDEIIETAYALLSTGLFKPETC